MYRSLASARHPCTRATPILSLVVALATACSDDAPATGGLDLSGGTGPSDMAIPQDAGARDTGDPLDLASSADAPGDDASGEDGGVGDGGLPEEDMVDVPAGPFLMGCNEPLDTQCAADERPGRMVDLPAFRIDRTEVTARAWSSCIRARVCTQPSQAAASPDHPVIWVTWTEARDFCAWRGARLPTEEEWEKAARGTDGRIWPTGNMAPTCEEANFGPCHDGAWPAGSRPRASSPYGALDMAGNVFEYTDSWYDATQMRKVIRGGDSNNTAARARASKRDVFVVDSRFSGLGFRCAR